MRDVLGGSWGFVEDDDEMAHVALYIRDALRLDVPAGPDQPPPLDPAVPARRGVLDDARRREAAAQWPTWWESVLADAAHRSQGPPAGADTRAWMEELQERGTRTGSFPAYAALADRPALREALIALTPEACRWVEGPRQAARQAFTWELIHETAEDIAFDHRVPLDTVHGMALVLTVHGTWWARHRSGLVLCSPAATRDPVTARTILRAAFEAGPIPGPTT